MIQPTQIFTVFGSCFVEPDVFETNKRRPNAYDGCCEFVNTYEDKTSRFAVNAGTKPVDIGRLLPLDFFDSTAEGKAMLLSTSPTPMCLKCNAQTRLHSEQLACGDRRMFVFVSALDSRC